MMQVEKLIEELLSVEADGENSVSKRAVFSDERCRVMAARKLAEDARKLAARGASSNFTPEHREVAQSRLDAEAERAEAHLRSVAVDAIHTAAGWGVTIKGVQW